MLLIDVGLNPRFQPVGLRSLACFSLVLTVSIAKAKNSVTCNQGYFAQVFDDLDIEDPSVADSARSVGLPLPAEVLSTCLKR